MKDKKTSIVLKEYYNIISPLLAYSSCNKINEIERQVLLLLCENKGCIESFDEYMKMIESARCLQSYTDAALLQTTEETEHSIAYDMKMNALASNRISKLRGFDEDTFIEELRYNANTGDRSSCKLLAFLSWLGLIVPQNKSVAQNIWSLLTMSGDRLALEMLIYGYINMGDDEAQVKWSNIRDILQNEFELFSPVALYSAYPKYSEKEIQTANLIMFISQKESGNVRLDRPMLYYALNSNDDYQTKMSRLSTDTNYYIALHDEERFSKKKYWF